MKNMSPFHERGKQTKTMETIYRHQARDEQSELL